MKFIHPDDLKKFAPRFCKVLHVHLNRIFYRTNFLQDVSPEHEIQFMKPTKECRLFIESCLPGVRFVFINRVDTIAQAVSYCLAAEISKIKGHSFFQMNSKEQQTEFQNTIVSVSDETLFSFFKVCIAYRNVWDDFLEGSNCFKINYEDISEEKIGGLLDYLGFPNQKVSCDVSTFTAASSRIDVSDFYQRLRSIANFQSMY